MARLLRRPQRGWWHTPAGWALAIGAANLAGLVSIPFCAHAPVWLAAGAAIASLPLILAAAAGTWFDKRRAWLYAAPIGFCFGFGFFVALQEGWGDQVRALLESVVAATAIGVIGLMVAAFVVLGRGFRRLNRARKDVAREVGEELRRVTGRGSLPRRWRAHHDLR